MLALACLGGTWMARASRDEKAPQTAARPSIYDKNADAKVQVAEATAKAKREDKRVLLMFGGDWCGWCHKLHTLFRTNPEIRRLLSYEYELVMIDTQAPHAEEFLRETSKGQTGVGFPFLAVLDAGGKLLIGQKTDPLEEGDHHDPKKVNEFLARWVVEPRVAKAVLGDALDRASSEDKKVFLSFGAPWCGWCHRLENFLARPEIAAIMERDFVVVKIDNDRMTGGKDVMAKYRPADSQSGGIPWFVILDGRGDKLATSDALDAPNKNIGYPATDKEIAAFMGIIEAQHRRMDEGQIKTLRRELEQAGAKIEAEMKQRAEEAARKAKK
jgi:thioredoxin-related protein